MYNSVHIPLATPNLCRSINTLFGEIWKSPVIDKTRADLDLFMEEGVCAKEAMMGTLIVLEISIFFDRMHIKLDDTDTEMSTDKIFYYFLKTYKIEIDKIESTNQTYNHIYLRCVFKNFVHVKRYDKT